MLAAALATFLLTYAATYPQFLLAALGVGIAGAPCRWASPKSRAGIRQAGMIAAAFSVPASLFRAYGGHLSDVYGARRVMYWTFLVSGPPRDQEEVVIRALLEQEVKVPTADEATCRRNFARNPALFRTGDDGGKPRRASNGTGHLILSGYFCARSRKSPPCPLSPPDLAPPSPEHAFSAVALSSRWRWR